MRKVRAPAVSADLCTGEELVIGGKEYAERSERERKRLSERNKEILKEILTYLLTYSMEQSPS